MGSGRAAEWIVNGARFRNYYGVDVTEGLVAEAKKRLQGLDHPDERLRVADIRSYRSEARQYDGILASDLLLYLSPREQLEALRNIAAMLKDGGVLFIHWASGQDTVELKEKPIPGGVAKGWVFTVTPSYLEELLRMAGLTLLEPIKNEPAVFYSGTPPTRRVINYLSAFAGKRAAAPSASEQVPAAQD